VLDIQANNDNKHEDMPKKNITEGMRLIWYILSTYFYL